MKFYRFILIPLLALVFLTACKTTGPHEEYKGATAQGIFDSAESNLAKRHYESAVHDFEALDAIYPFGAYAQQGQLDIIYAYYKKGDTDSALAAADRYIRLYPRADNVDYAYYMKGLINLGPMDGWMEYWTSTDIAQRDLTHMHHAFEDFSVLVNRFPNSPYTPDARKRLVFIRNILAQRQLEVAQFYMKRKVYVGAANRAADLVRDYPGAPQVIPALGILVEAYRALGQKDMADESLRILVTHYPNSEETKRLRQAGK